MARFADRTRPPRPLRQVAGALLAAAILALILALLLSIAGAAGPSSTVRWNDVLTLVTGGVIQAGLSTILSLALGIAIAWALNRLRFVGRGLFVALLAAAIVTPGLIVAFGLLAVWGRAGWLGVLHIPVFGLGGVVAAHVILDASFAARLLLARLDALPPARLKTGQSLGLTALERFRHIDWPALAPSLPGLAAIIFLLAFTSFPIVLLLGGGPAVQTLEVAIYAAVRLDFDLGRAVLLALVQLAVCGAIVVLAAFAPAPVTRLAAPATPLWRDGVPARLLAGFILIATLLFFGLPLLAVLVEGVRGLGGLVVQPVFWQALATSLVIAGLSAGLALGLGLVAASARATTGRPLLRMAFQFPAYTYLAVPAVTLALGAFLIVRTLGGDPTALAPSVVILTNALLALPYALATLAPGFDAIALTRGKLVRSLGLTGWRQFAAVEWPLIAPDAGVVLALAAGFSLGDLGVVALFGGTGFVTLPLLMLRALGAYRSADAAGIAAVMLVLAVLAFVLIPRLTRSFRDA